jgi:hypothetical protein
MEDPAALADQVGDAITAVTGRAWGESARARLAASLEDPQLRGIAGHRLDEDRPDEPTDIDWARRLLSRVLSGRSTLGHRRP